MYQSYPVPSRFQYLLLLFVLSTTSSVLAAPNDVNPVRPGTVIYKTISTVAADDLKGLNALLKSHGLVAEETLTGSQITIATFQQKGREIAIANILKHSGYVEFAEPDYAMPPSLQPNDFYFGNQWHHNNVNSQQAWNITTGSSNVLVAVCDTGFDVSHPDLAANLRTDLAYNAQDGSTYIYDANGHGTGTAGTLGAVGNNDIGVAGANWNVDIIPVRIAISNGNSSAYISTMAKCIEYAADNDARVVNLSYGGIEYATIDAAAQYLRARNGLLFMSAGNDYQEFASHPDYTSFIGVGATDENNNRADFSNWGTFVDITAPGVDIATTYPNNEYVYYTGTSFSSPLAAGIAALMVAANPNITVSELENGIFSTTVDIGVVGNDNVFGHGLIDAAAAVSYASSLVSNEEPTAVIADMASSYDIAQPITFRCVGSSDNDGSISRCDWNFGNGETATGKVDIDGNSVKDVDYPYPAGGNYTVTLTVTDDDGAMDSTTVDISIVDPNILTAPSNLEALVEGMDVQLNWQDTNDSAIHFVIERGVKFRGRTQFTVIPENETLSADTTSYMDTVSETGDYSYRITVVNDTHEASSEIIRVTVDTSSPDPEPDPDPTPGALLAPSNLVALQSGNAIDLNWTNNASDAEGFYIERSIKQKGRTEVYPLITFPETGTIIEYSDVISGLPTGNYSYRVRAYKEGEVSDFSNSVELRVK